MARNLVLVSFLVLQLTLRGSAGIGSESRETILDRKTHIEENLHLDVPQVSPLCDRIKALVKGNVDIGDGKLYVEQEGKGTPIVLISGGPGCTHHMFHLWFSRAAKFGRVIYYDQRGVGQSDYDSTNAKYTIKEAVVDLDNLRKVLGIQKWVVVGHSYGGFLAQCYALEHADRVLGLVLITAEPGMPSLSLNQSRRYEYMNEEEKLKIGSIMNNDKLTEEQKLYNSFLNGNWKRQNYYRPTIEELAMLSRYAAKPAPGFHDHIMASMQLIDLSDAFVNFKVPTMIMESEWDLTWNTDKPEKFLSRHPGAQFVIFEKSGHTPYADEPGKFFMILRRFVSRVKDDSQTAGIQPDSRVVSFLQAAYRINELPWTGVGKEALSIYESLGNTGTANPAMWGRLGAALYDGKYYDEALVAFRRIDTSDSSVLPFWRFASLVWQGHILDLQNHRDDAVKCYQAALNIDSVRDGDRWDCPWYGFTINRQWAQERLKTPFIRK